MPAKPKKQPLNQMLYEIDGDFLRDIILNLVETSPELEDRVRILITPKKLINNSLNYYKKQIIKVPAVDTKAKVKMANEILKPLLLTASDLEKSKNYLEATKIYQAILETLLAKARDFGQKDVDSLFSQIAQNWSRTVGLIDNHQEQFNSMRFLFELKNDKSLIKNDFVGYFLTEYGIGEEVKPGIMDFYYDLFGYLCQSLTNIYLVEDVQNFIKKQEKSEKYLVASLNLLRNLGKTDDFFDLAHKYIGQTKVLNLLKKYHLASNDWGSCLLVIFRYLETNQKYFEFKNSDEYKIAQEFLDLARKHPEIDLSSQIQQVLIWIITTGNDQWKYDVSLHASWWLDYGELRKNYPENWKQNYQKIIDLLISKKLKDQLLSICAYEGDVQTTLTHFRGKNNVETDFDVANIIFRQEPVKALEMYTRYFRYRDPYYYRQIYDQILENLTELGKLLPAEKKSGWNKLMQKVRRKDY